MGSAGVKNCICSALIVLLLLGLFASFPVAAEQAAQLCDDILSIELPRLRGFQLPGGAITMYDIRGGGTSQLNPYFSCSAALGLLAGGDMEAAERYIRWHFGHLEETGIIYDYTVRVEEGAITEISSLGCDSTDSYAALFLVLLDEYAKAGGVNALLTEHRDAIARVVGAMDATFHFGLTYAKPGYRIYFLMDNCEAAAGYRAAASLWKQLGSPWQALRCVLRALCIRLAVNLRLWNFRRGSYDYALDTPSDPAIFYPDAAAQLFPLAFGLLRPSSGRAGRLYRDFLANQPQWLEGHNGGDYPWVILLRAALAMGDTDTVAQYLRAVKELCMDGAASGRWYCQESGLAVWAAVRLKMIGG